MSSAAELIRTLQAQEPELRALGVLRVGIFGSVARGDANMTSDIDILVDLDPARHLSLFDLIGIKHHLDDTFGRPVDLVSRRSLKASIRRSVERDVIYAF